MAQYLTYDEYINYGGDMPESDFTLAEFKARSRIDRLTLGRVRFMETVPEEVKLAMMCIIRVDSKYSSDRQTYTAVVSSFNTDGYSESYGTASEQAAIAEKQITREVTRYLMGVMYDDTIPLIYLGVD